MQNNSLIGNLVATPVLNKGEKPWTKIRVACETLGDTLWVDIFYSGKLAEQIAQYLEKGRQVYVEYTIKNAEYEKNGVKVKTFDFYGTRCEFLGQRKNDNAEQV